MKKPSASKTKTSSAKKMMNGGKVTKKTTTTKPAAKKMMNGGYGKKKMKYPNGGTPMAPPSQTRQSTVLNPRRKTGTPPGTGTINIWGG